MRTTKWAVALACLALAAVLTLLSVSAPARLPALVARLDPNGHTALDDKMLKAEQRILTNHAANDRERTIRYLNRYTGDYADQLDLTPGNALDLFFVRFGPALISLGVFMAVAGLMLLLSLVPGLVKHQKAMVTVVLITALFTGVSITETLAGSSSMLTTVLKKGAIYALLAVSMNLLNGFTGLFSLGQAGFMLVGAYTYAIFTIAAGQRAQVYQYYDGGLIQFQLPALAAIALAGLAAAFFAFLIGLPVLRLKSDYLAIATLGFAEIIRAVFQYDGLGPITNGSNLISEYTTFSSALYPFAVAGGSIALILMLMRSTYGRAFMAIRDDETAAEAMGISLFRHKQMAFVISSFFAGVGGALLAMYQNTVQASAFQTAMTYEILLIVVIGGMGSVSGSVIASFLFITLSEWWLRFLDAEQMIGTFEVPLLRSGFRMVVFSAVIMLVVLFYRKGLMGDKEISLSGLFGRLRRRKGLPHA